MPKLSVIIPVYNTEKYIEECVESVRAQTLSDIEIILVNDGSTDSSPEIMATLAEEDSRIRLVSRKNGGIGLARNSGLDIARGEYIAFVDSDDIIDKNMLLTLLTAAEENDADMAMTGMTHVGGAVFAGEDAIKYDFKKLQVFRGNGDMQRLALGTAGALPSEAEDTRYGYSSCKNIYRRSIIEENGIRFCSERVFISEDVLFIIDFIFCAQCAVGVPGAFYLYRRNEGSTSKSYKEGCFERCKLQITEIKRRLSEKIPEEVYKTYCDRQLQAYARFSLSQEIMRPCESAEVKRQQTENIRMIIHDDMLCEALKGFWWLKLPKKQAIFALCMKLKLSTMLRLLVKLRERI